MADNQNPVLFLQAVDRRYAQGDTALEILKGVEFGAWLGQSVALVAPSGTGKSTLLHIAGLLEHPDGGEVYIDGIATSKLPDAERTASAAPKWVSSIRRITCCRNSPRSRMS